jgi:hypothetical protein
LKTVGGKKGQVEKNVSRQRRVVPFARPTYPIERKTTNPDGESNRPRNQHHVIDTEAMIARAIINSKQVNPLFRIEIS